MIFCMWWSRLSHLFKKPRVNLRYLINVGSYFVGIVSRKGHNIILLTIIGKKPYKFSFTSFTLIFLKKKYLKITAVLGLNQLKINVSAVLDNNFDIKLLIGTFLKKLYWYWYQDQILKSNVFPFIRMQPFPSHSLHSRDKMQLLRNKTYPRWTTLYRLEIWHTLFKYV